MAKLTGLFEPLERKWRAHLLYLEREPVKLERPAVPAAGKTIPDGHNIHRRLGLPSGTLPTKAEGFGIGAGLLIVVFIVKRLCKCWCRKSRNQETHQETD